MSHAFREPNKVELAEDTPEKLKAVLAEQETGEVQPQKSAPSSPENDESDQNLDESGEHQTAEVDEKRIQNVLGTIIDGKYKIIEAIGSGGMSEVFKAVHISTKRPVALKLLRPKYMTNPESVSRFQLEAKAASRLDHKTSFTFTSLA